MPRRETSAPTLQAWILLAILGLIWGSSFAGAKYALLGFEPLTIAAGRIALGALLLTGVSYALGHGLPKITGAADRRIWLHALGMALFSNVVPFSLLNWGQQYVDSGFAGISMAVVPLFVLPLAHFLIPGDRMTILKTIGFCLGFVGVLILIGPAALVAGDADLVAFGRLACVAASCCYATGAIITRLSPQVHPIAFASAGLVLGALIAVPLALWVEGLPEMSAQEPIALAALVYLGVFPTALATFMLVYIISTVSPTFLSLVNYQVPVWAAILGVVLLAETLPAAFLAALALILCGLAISQFGPKRLAAFRSRA